MFGIGNKILPSCVVATYVNINVIDKHLLSIYQLLK